MSVTEVILYKTGASGKASGNGQQSPKIEYTANYFVTASPTDTAYEVLAYFRSNGPWIGSPFSYSSAFDADATCVDVNATPIENSLGKFHVVAQFSTNGSEDDDNNNDDRNKDDKGKKTDDPLKWHDEIDVSTTQVSVPIEYATYIGPNPANEFLRPGKINRDPCNSAGVPFDPLPEYELDITVLRITKNVANYDEGQIAPYRGTINSDGFVIQKPAYKFTFPVSPLVAKIKQWSGSFHFAGEIPYWKQTIELHINPLGWRFPLLDRGTTKVVEDDDPDSSTYHLRIPKRLVDAGGVPLTEPQKLNGNGGLLRPGADPVYLVYGKYLEVPYGNLIW